MGNMDYVFIFISIFVVLLTFMIINTLMGETVLPLLNETGSGMSFVVNNSAGFNLTNFETQSQNAQNSFWAALFIILIIPFLFLMVRLLKREPEATEVVGGVGF